MIIKKALFLIVALASVALLVNRTHAMGILQGQADYIPTPETNIGFTIIDKLGVRTAVVHGSIDGRDYIAGYNGMILNVIPMINIASITFTNASIAALHLPAELLDKLDNNPLIANINLKDNKVVTLIVDGSLLCYGKTQYGYIRVKLLSLDVIEDIKQLKKDTVKQ